MYCGDETGSFIGDIGSNSARFGYGGEDAPNYVVPSFVRETSKSVPTSFYQPAPLQSPLGRLDTLSTQASDYLTQGDSIQDWDAYEALWEKALLANNVVEQTKANSTSTNLSVKGEKLLDSKCLHPLLVVAPGAAYSMNQSSSNYRNKQLIQMTELFMEKFQAKAVFVAPSSMLSSFCSGRQTSLVVDVGASGCRVTPVVDGHLLKQAQRRNGRGGDYLGSVAFQALSNAKQVVRPRYQLGASNDPKSRPSNDLFRTLALQDLMYELRTSEYTELPQWWYNESAPFCDTDESMEEEEEEEGEEAVAKHYELPDGTLVDLTTQTGKDLCRTPELLFTDDVPFCESLPKLDHPTLSHASLPKLIHESLSAVTDVDVRKELAANIVLVGGSSRFKNFEQRLSLELNRLIPNAYKTKVIASKHAVERSCSSWIGGSILSSLGSFQQLWLSKAEYEEYGATLAVQRFPG